jgi:protein-S-isoprenylcysteine O-methyltransferase Ste14
MARHPAVVNPRNNGRGDGGPAPVSFSRALELGHGLGADRHHGTLGHRYRAGRLGPKRGGKRWDTAIMGIVGLGTIARCIVAGLDVRHGWTTGMLWAFQALALVIAALSYALVVWATGSNAYFSLTVRIQKERGHAVATGGPYRFVRHPSYVGGILFELAAPILLGSWWALIPGMLNAILFVVRTALEDKTLQAELDGYQDYAARVRYRLLPGVW